MPSELTKLSVEDGVGVVTIDSPPVNALGVTVRAGLDTAFKQFAIDSKVKAVVLSCGGRTFFVGADISEFGKPLLPPLLDDVFGIIEHGNKPVIAAIHGTALGGGLELALICHYRLATPSAKLGLPEVNLGLLPGGGGTQRLPRLIGVERALEFITGGKPIGAQQALEWGILDALTEEAHLRRDAIAFARKVISDGTPLRRVRDLGEKVIAARGEPEIFSAFRSRNARKFRGFKAPENIIKAIEAAVELPFDQGLQREHELFMEQLSSTESAAQRYAFFAERETAKVPDVPADTPAITVRSIGIIGAGTMGSGIAMNFLNMGMPVTLVEANKGALDRGISVIRSNYEMTAKKGRLTIEQVEQRMALISPQLDLGSLATVDLIIEAVFESLELKMQVFSVLDGVAKQGAILASNTSFLDLDQIAAVTRRPESVIGMHFFSPANVMRLLEIVRGKATSKSVVATALKLAKQIGKVPVLSRVCHGFIANRLMYPRTRQADSLVLQGPMPQEIDRAMVDYGFPIGPFQMMDLAGLDVVGRDSAARSVRGDLVVMGRLGQKTNAGYYDYDANRTATPSPIAANVIEAFAQDFDIHRIGRVNDEEIAARLLYPVVNEGAKLLEEGIALRASDIDVAAMTGYGWPVYQGGPMFWADTVGLQKIVSKLEDMQSMYGDEFKPSSLLQRLAGEGGKLHKI
jgi:3-hydroxyacyl-CoA dehydrogenase